MMAVFYPHWTIDKAHRCCLILVLQVDSLPTVRVATVDWVPLDLPSLPRLRATRFLLSAACANARWHLNRTARPTGRSHSCIFPLAALLVRPRLLVQRPQIVPGIAPAQTNAPWPSSQLAHHRCNPPFGPSPSLLSGLPVARPEMRLVVQGCASRAARISEAQRIRTPFATTQPGMAIPRMRSTVAWAESEASCVCVLNRLPIFRPYHVRLHCLISVLRRSLGVCRACPHYCT